MIETYNIISRKYDSSTNFTDVRHIKLEAVIFVFKNFIFTMINLFYQQGRRCLE